MRWELHLSMLILVYCIAAANCEQTRKTRDLNTIFKIKKAVLTSVLGASNSVPTSDNKPEGTIKLYLVPGHQDVLITAVPATNLRTYVPYDTLKHYLGTKTPEETLAALQRIEKLLKSGLLSESLAEKMGLGVNAPIVIDPRFPETSEHGNRATGENFSFSVSTASSLSGKLKPNVVPVATPAIAISKSTGYSYKQIHRDGSVTEYTSDPELYYVRPTPGDSVPDTRKVEPPCELRGDFPEGAFDFPPINTVKTTNEVKPFDYSSMAGGYYHQQGSTDEPATIYSNDPEKNGVTVDTKLKVLPNEESHIEVDALDHEVSSAGVVTHEPSVPVVNLVVPEVHQFYHGIPHHHQYYNEVPSIARRPIFVAPHQDSSEVNNFELPGPLPTVKLGCDNTYIPHHTKPIPKPCNKNETTTKRPGIMHSLLLNRIENVANSISVDAKVKAIAEDSMNSKHQTSGYSYKQIGHDGSVTTYTDKGTYSNTDETDNPPTKVDIKDSNQVVVETSVASKPYSTIPLNSDIPVSRPVDVAPIPHQIHMDVHRFHNTKHEVTNVHTMPVVTTPYLLPGTPKPTISHVNMNHIDKAIVFSEGSINNTEKEEAMGGYNKVTDEHGGEMVDNDLKTVITNGNFKYIQINNNYESKTEDTLANKPIIVASQTDDSLTEEDNDRSYNRGDIP